MQKLTYILFFTGLSASAGAHMLPSDSPLQLSHQLLSLHHLPGIVLLLLVAGVVILAAKTGSTRNKQ